MINPASLDWPRIAAMLDDAGAAVLPALLGGAQIAALREPARAQDGYANDHWHSADLLPTPLPAWLRAFQHRLAPIADQWHARMAAPPVGCATPAHVAFSRLAIGEYAPLRQSVGAATSFPLQLVILLSSPGSDFSGGECVLTEQRPRMQSRPMVLPLAAGDVAIIAGARRPVRGARGDYQVNVSHAIGRVRGGERLGMACIFHNPIGTATFGH